MQKEKFFDENLWIGVKSPSSTVEAKKAAMQSLGLLKSYHSSLNNSNHENLNFIFSDIDITAFAFNKYLFQNSNILNNKKLQQLLSDEKNAIYIIENGCLSEILNFILTKHQKIKKDFTIVKKILSISSDNIKFFAEEVKNPDFYAFLIKNDFISLELLKMFPQNDEISIALVKKGIIPFEHSKKYFSSVIFDDLKLVKKTLKSKLGYSFYSQLPEELRKDEKICSLVKKIHPNVNVEISPIKNINDFMKFFDENFYKKESLATELYTLSDNILKHKFILENPDSLLRIFKELEGGDYSCLVDLMGGPHFSEHPIQEVFINAAQYSSKIQDFLNHDLGKIIIGTKISNYSDFSNFETQIIPHIYKNLNTFLTISNRFDMAEKQLKNKLEDTKKVIKI